MTRDVLAPSDIAAVTYSRSRSTSTMARTPRATRGQAMRTKIAAIIAKTAAAGITSGSAARSTSRT